MSKHKRPKPTMVELKEGQELYSFATGGVNPLFKSCREAVNYIASLDGFIGVFTEPEGRCLWMFDTENNAKGSRNLCRMKGIKIGNNICKWVVKDGIPTFDDDFAIAHGFIKGE